MNRRQLRDIVFKRRMVQNIIFCILAGTLLGVLGTRMGWNNMITTMTATGYSLMVSVMPSIIAVVVISGAWAALLQEFGIVYALEKTLGRFIGWIYGLPAKSLLGAILSFLSDPTVVTSIAANPKFTYAFRRYQVAGMIHFSTSFGMGMVLIAFMIGMDYPKEYGVSLTFCAGVGLLATFIASALTTRLQNWWLRHSDESLNNTIQRNATEMSLEELHEKAEDHIQKYKQTFFSRVLDSIIDGGKSGFNLGLAIAPGVMVVSTLIFMVTFGPGEHGYDGSAYQGVPFTPWLADKADFVFDWMFGFKDSELVTFPITSLASLGAAIGQLPQFVDKGILTPNAACVFTAMGVSWSGFLSVYGSIMDEAGMRAQAGVCMMVHFASGLLAGTVAHWLFTLYTLM